MTDLPDDALREAFEPLRQCVTTPTEIKAALARRGAERRVRQGASRRAVIAVLPLVAAVSLIVALAPSIHNDSGRPAIALLPDRAQAAITPAQRILELTIRLDRSTTEPDDATPPSRTSMREWSLAGGGRAMQTRMLITEGRLDMPPTDEDTTLLLDREGSIIDLRSWTPIGTGPRGQLALLDFARLDPNPGPATLVGRLRLAYEERRLRAAGTAPNGALRLRGKLLGGPCERTEILLDPRTFIPRRIGTVHQCGRDAAVRREVQTITAARILPATTQNRRLLQIDDWPVARTGRSRITEQPFRNEFTPLERLPPPPPLDEG